MRAVRYDGQSVVLDTRAPEPAVAPGDALVRPTLLAIGAADLAVAAGSIPFTGTLGHRFVGLVEKVEGEPAHPLTARRVAGNINLPSADSDLAKRGLGTHDPARSMLGLRTRGGCFADRFTIPANQLAPVPDAVADESAVFAVPLGDAIHARNLVRLDAKSFVTVLGDNLPALLCAQIMSQRNATVRLLGSSAERLELCAKWGVKHRRADEVGRRADQDVVVDCTESSRGLPLAMWLVRPRGTIILKAEPVPIPGATPGEGVSVDLTPAIERELTIIGARCGSVVEAVAMMNAGQVDLGGLVTRRFKLDDAVEAFRCATDPESLTVLIEP